MTDQLKNLTTIIMAGGKGERLFPLTRDKAKPAITFGSLYRIIDFTLSNCLNSGIRRIYVLTQYGSFSLDQHLRQAWDIMHPDLDEFIYSMPPQQIMVSRWYRGTADSIFQNLNLLEAERPKHVLILSGDHVYKLNYREMLDFHLDRGADLTVAAVMVPRVEGSSFGILKVNGAGEVENFLEKPAGPAGIARQPGVLPGVHGGLYFQRRGAGGRGHQGRQAQDQQARFRRQHHPPDGGAEKVYAYNFQDPASGTPRYWRDIGLLDAYFKAHQDLLGAAPTFELFDPEWPMRSRPQLLPPSKFITGGMPVTVEDSLIASGCMHRRDRGPVDPLPRGDRGGGCDGGRRGPVGSGGHRPPGQGQARHYRRRGAGAAGVFHRLRPPVGRGPLPPHRKRRGGGAQQCRHGGLRRMSSMAAAAKGSLTPTRLYLVRHGQVADGHTDRYHGNNDIGLSLRPLSR